MPLKPVSRLGIGMLEFLIELVSAIHHGLAEHDHAAARRAVQAASGCAKRDRAERIIADALAGYRRASASRKPGDGASKFWKRLREPLTFFHNGG